MYAIRSADCISLNECSDPLPHCTTSTFTAVCCLQEPASQTEEVQYTIANLDECKDLSILEQMVRLL